MFCWQGSHAIKASSSESNKLLSDKPSSKLSSKDSGFWLAGCNKLFATTDAQDAFASAFVDFSDVFDSIAFVSAALALWCFDGNTLVSACFAGCVFVSDEFVKPDEPDDLLLDEVCCVLLCVVLATASPHTATFNFNSASSSSTTACMRVANALTSAAPPRVCS